jgi:predicted amidohydrolase YtcJ
MKIKEMSYALEDAVRNGITGIQSNDTKETGLSDGWEVYEEILKDNRGESGCESGKLPVRVFFTSTWKDGIEIKEDVVPGEKNADGSQKKVTTYKVTDEYVRPCRVPPSKSSTNGSYPSNGRSSSSSSSGSSNTSSSSSGSSSSSSSSNSGLGFLYTDRCKIFMDGGLGASTAAMVEPYEEGVDDAGGTSSPKRKKTSESDDMEKEGTTQKNCNKDPTEEETITQKNCGLITMTDKDLEVALDTAFDRGFRIEAHAIGDAALDKIIDFFCEWKKKGRLLKRPVLTHCQIIHERTWKKMREWFPVDEKEDGGNHEKEEGGGNHGNHSDSKNKPTDSKNNHTDSNKTIKTGPLIADIQPQFTNSDLPIIEKKIGLKRARFSYCWKEMMQYCVLAGGSDSPVEPMKPLCGMAESMRNVLHTKEFRERWNEEYGGKDGKDSDAEIAEYLKEGEDLSFAQALQMYTSNAAFAACVEDRLGKLKVGFEADFVVTKMRINGGNTNATESPKGGVNVTVQEAIQKVASQILESTKFQSDGVEQTWVKGLPVFMETRVEKVVEKAADSDVSPTFKIVGKDVHGDHDGLIDDDELLCMPAGNGEGNTSGGGGDAKGSDSSSDPFDSHILSPPFVGARLSDTASLPGHPGGSGLAVWRCSCRVPKCLLLRGL